MQQKQSKQQQQLMTQQVKSIKISDTSAKGNIGISLWKSSTLQEITKRSGPLAKNNEYQVHYWALNLRYYSDDESFFDLSIPTVFFNYPQEVSGGHIDFELKDVDNVSQPLEVIQRGMVNKLQEELKELLPEIGYSIDDFKLISSKLNTLHRHPGGRKQSFSLTDLNTDSKRDTGVVFPLVIGDNSPSFSSIIAHEKNNTYLAHSEYRIANGDATTPEGIIYKQYPTATFISGLETKQTKTEELFNIPSKIISDYFLKDTSVEKSEIVQSIINIWKKCNFEPHVEFINPNNVKEKVIKPVNKNYFKNTKNTNINSNNKQLKSTNDMIKEYLHPTMIFEDDYNEAQIQAKEEITTKFGINFRTNDELLALDSTQRLLHLSQLQAMYYGEVDIDLEDEITVFDIEEMYEIIIDEYITVGDVAFYETIFSID